MLLLFFLDADQPSSPTEEIGNEIKQTIEFDIFFLKNNILAVSRIIGYTSEELLDGMDFEGKFISMQEKFVFD